MAKAGFGGTSGRSTSIITHRRFVGNERPGNHHRWLPDHRSSHEWYLLTFYASEGIEKSLEKDNWRRVGMTRRNNWRRRGSQTPANKLTPQSLFVCTSCGEQPKLPNLHFLYIFVQDKPWCCVSIDKRRIGSDQYFLFMMMNSEFQLPAGIKKVVVTGSSSDRAVINNGLLSTTTLDSADMRVIKYIDDGLRNEGDMARQLFQSSWRHRHQLNSNDKS